VLEVWRTALKACRAASELAASKNVQPSPLALAWLFAKRPFVVSTNISLSPADVSALEQKGNSASKGRLLRAVEE
jgi:aryl-alcohol dehydrogenase-like predicted oxidoreductase